MPLYAMEEIEELKRWNLLLDKRVQEQQGEINYLKKEPSSVA